MLEMCLSILYLVIELHLIWANKELHQNFRKDSRNLMLGWVVLVVCGISFTAVYISISMYLLNFHLQLPAVNNKRGIFGKFRRPYSNTSILFEALLTKGFLDKFYFFTHLFRFLYCCRLYRAYQNIYASMHDKEIGPHKTQFRRDENYGTFVVFL